MLITSANESRKITEKDLNEFQRNLAIGGDVCFGFEAHLEGDIL